MKKTLKIVGITLLSIIGVVLIVASVAIWIVFSPEKLTPIVRDQLPKFVLAETSVEKVDLTFFSTFPEFGLHLKNVCIKNPTENAPSDTVAFIEDCTAAVDVSAFLCKNEVILENLYLTNLFANLYTDSVGNTNFDIFPPSEEDNDTTPFALPFELINLKKVEIKGVTALYTDEKAKIFGEVHDLNLDIEGSLINENVAAKAFLQIGKTAFEMNDSMQMAANINSLILTIDGNKNTNDLQGTINLQLPDISFVMNQTNFVKSGNVTLDLPFEANIENKNLTLEKAKIALNEFAISLNGKAAYKENKDIETDLAFATNEWDVKQLLKIVPEQFTEPLKDMKINGLATLSGTAKGIFNNELLPKINANVQLKKGTFAYKSLPCDFHDLALNASADLNLNKGEKSSATITKLSAKTGGNSFTISGKANDLLNKMSCDVALKANLNLPELKPFLPNDMAINLQGKSTADIKAKFLLDDVLNLNLEKINANGTVCLNNLDVAYDSILATSPEVCLTINLPAEKRTKRQNALLTAKLTSPDLNVKMVGSLNANVKNANFDIITSNPLDTTKMLAATCNFDMQHLVAQMDTLAIDIKKPQGKIAVSPARGNAKQPQLQCSYSSETLLAEMGKALHVDTKFIKISATTTYNEKEENLYLRFSPRLHVDFNDGNIMMAQSKSPIKIPAIKFDFTPRQLNISDSRVIIDDSDFKLTGEATNIRNFFAKKGLLKGNFDFVSEKTNINQLMDVVSGFGNSDTVAVASTQETSTTEESDPFMVPKGIDVALNTNIKNAIFNDNLLQNVGGKLTVKDGVLVLEQMGFTCDAAEMQLTAMYRSERKNHLFAGINFHLLNIDIKQLIHMIPSIDTIVPMLKSFEGRAQFHLSAETYLKSNYDLKMSTLRGAASIEGKDLVLLDNETFAKIAKPLMFSRKTKNLVDSIGVEMTIFRNEVDLYPFAVSMDNYSAVVSGRYDLDQNYNAHIETLSPVRLALQIKGSTADFDNMKFDLVPTKYSNLYKPEKRNINEERVMELKKMISDSLKETVK